ncbi:MAG TPA: hypothetical protein VGG24_00855, partial [Paraburkholderia sp.]
GPRYELDGTASEGPGIEPSHIARANAALARQKAKAEARVRETAQPQNGEQPNPDAQQAGAPVDTQTSDVNTAAPPTPDAEKTFEAPTSTAPTPAAPDAPVTESAADTEPPAPEA